MKHQLRHCSFWRGFTAVNGMCVLLLFGTLVLPVEALGQAARYWSTNRGMAGVRVAAPARTENAQPMNKPETKAAISSSASKIADRAQARGSLRFNWDALKDSDHDKPEGVTVELQIDARTDASLRALSADTGVSYKRLLSEFLRLGQSAYVERRYWARSRYYAPAYR